VELEKGRTGVKNRDESTERSDSDSTYSRRTGDLRMPTDDPGWDWFLIDNLV
jgi:hypothetical protein